ncbi:hypothetical protein [Saccharicrinis aurantiacus]|uniref:hypothetical protein n=1 Tax=Saccharicrinis aurantiacus TaxID=1849719 RepID=UPI00095028FF|nr:hypothetical protein [Saccharicrinis aurantiacus]
MGLKERRIAQQFEQEQLPELTEQINKAAGFEVEMEIKWETLVAEERFNHLLADSYPKVYFQPLIEAFTAICADDMGKEALQESLKKVLIVNENNHHNPTHAYSFSDGILKVDHSPIMNVDDVKSRTEKLNELLENSL